jgi:hypothetical protein
MKFRAVEELDTAVKVVILQNIGKPLRENERSLYTIEAPTWEEAMAEHHRRQGYEPYKPEGEPSPCIRCGSPTYQDGSGDCGPCGDVKVETLTDGAVEALLYGARWGLSHGMEFDNMGHAQLVALCEEVLMRRGLR